MGPLEALALGAVQGVTEFLPVSSSGHLVLAQSLLGTDLAGATAAFDVSVHVGTLVAVLAVYRADLVKLVSGFFKAFATAVENKSATEMWSDESSRYVLILGLATMPAAVLGLAFKDTIEAMFDSVLAAGAGLLFTGAVLGLTRFATEKGKGPPNAGAGLLVGAAQAVAMVPGVSRSGSTIATALLLGVGRSEAARFSFLMSVPAIMGAAVLESRHMVGSLPAVPLAIGFFSAAVVGYLSLKVLLAMVDKGRIYLFAPYCLLLGLAAIFIWR